MRRILAIGLLPVCFATIPVGIFLLPQSQKRVVLDEFEPDRMARPATLEDMWLGATAVAVLKVLSAARLPAPSDPLGRRPRLGYDTTTYNAQVVEVIKNHSPYLTGAGQKVSVHREIGDTDVGEYIVRRIEKDFPAFVIGHQYVLFLEWNEYLQLFQVPHGPDASYDITTGVIGTSGGGAVAQSFNGKPAKDLLRQLEAIRKKHGR